MSYKPERQDVDLDYDCLCRPEVFVFHDSGDHESLGTFLTDSTLLGVGVELRFWEVTFGPGRTVTEGPFDRVSEGARSQKELCL